MTPTDRATAALLSVFPDIDALDSFVEDSKRPERLDTFVRFAHQHKVIDRPTESALRRFVAENRLPLDLCTPPPALSFEELIDNKTAWLEVDGSTRKMTDTINSFFQDQHLELTRISNSIISRLKQEPVNTPHKRDTLRAIAFWVGYERTHLAPAWNYYVLIRLCPNPERILSEKEGLSLRIHVLGTGREKVVDWLRDELRKSIQYLGLHHVNLKLMSASATTAFLNLPKVEGPAGEPTLFATAARDSMALVHQVMIRFYLSGFYGTNALVVAVSAGEFQQNNADGETLVDALLPEGNTVRFSHFAHLCVKIAGIKVVFDPEPTEARLPNGQITMVWRLKSFWNFSFYDFIPQLLDPAIIPESVTAPSFPEFRKALYFPHQRTAHKILTTLKRFPQNALLMLEVAKTLACRMMFHEANHVLTAILSSNPSHLVARTLRMQLLMNQSLVQNRFTVFNQLAERAIAEGQSLQRNHTVEESEFFCELGLVYLNTALRHLVFARNDGAGMPRSESQRIIIDLLGQAENRFQEGAINSPSGYDSRSTFWQFYATAFRRLIAGDATLLESNAPLTDAANVFPDVGENYLIQLGWLDGVSVDETFFENRFLDAIQRYESTVMLRSFKPSIYFSFAAILFDFIPVLNVRSVKQALMWLEQAKAETVKLMRDYDQVGVYGVANFFAQIVRADAFLNHIEAALVAVGHVVATVADLPDDALVERHRFPKKYRGMKLAFCAF